jgi:hypothetical protein
MSRWSVISAGSATIAMGVISGMPEPELRAFRAVRGFHDSGAQASEGTTDCHEKYFFGNLEQLFPALGLGKSGFAR